MNTQSEETWPVTVARRYPAAPLVGVAAVVFNVAGQALLVKRGHPPRQGSWGLPGGLLDLGERLMDGVRREVREECGVEIDVRGLVAAFEPIQRDEGGRVEYHYVVLDYWATLVSGEAVAQDDAAAVAWAGPEEWEGYELAGDTLAVVVKAYGYWEAFMLSSSARE
jgi:ADP-ribose pyrophosphatase YjhB (NUDIX family)